MQKSLLHLLLCLGLLSTGLTIFSCPSPAIAAPPNPAAPPSNTPQNGPFFGEVLVLHANNSGRGIDPSIAHLPQLKKPPFSSYNTYKLVSQHKPQLTINNPASIGLPNQRTLQITLKEIINAKKFRVATSINQPGGSQFLPLLEVNTTLNEPFFVAGQSHKDGILVMVIKIVK